jgi:bifunctional ADP-heptose synthase (sugar kinase/adenylyltransferase)
MKILIIGESCKDVFHYGVCDRICPEAPVPVFNSVELRENGGMAMNVYRNIISFGFEPKLITNTNWQSIIKTRFVDKRTNHMFLRLDENDHEYCRCEVSEINFCNHDAVIVSDYDKGFLTKKDLEFISQQHHLTFLDTKKILGEWSKNFTFIKINYKEYQKTFHTIDEDLKKILIITQGKDGCKHRDKEYEVPLVEIKDTSGAGDTFISALCIKYCETNDIGSAIRFANICSTSVVQKRGVTSP